jgi:predicted ATP-grasp superfamily ATP-dependent carboligase
MDELVELQERPRAENVYMIAGWRQWADAGSVSSGLPQYLIEHTGARKIGDIRPDGFYLFQVPGTHHFLRPEIKLEEGYRREMRKQKNELYYATYENTGLAIFLGDEPHMNVERYARCLFDAAQALQVKRIVALGGVYAPVPYEKARDVSATYSLPYMKDELAQYAVHFSDYEGGATIGTYLAHEAEARGIEMTVFYAMVPAYDFAQNGEDQEGLRIEDDYQAWYELARRFNHMFNLYIDLSELEERSEVLVDAMKEKVDDLAREQPELKVRTYLEAVAKDFHETPFTLLDEVWERELGDLFDDGGQA